MIISTIFCLIISGGAYFAGGFGRVIYSNIGLQPATDLNQVMPTVLSDQQVVGMPDAFLGLVIVLLLSASISTLTALVLSSSSILSIDLMGALFPKMKAQQTTLVMRLMCVAFVVFSLTVNFLLQNTPIISLMSLSWGTIAGSFLAPFLYGLLWKGVTKAGVYAGVIGGALTSLLPPLITGDFSLAPVSGACAMAAGLVLVPVVSLLTRKWAFSQSHISWVFGKKEQEAPAAAAGN